METERILWILVAVTFLLSLIAITATAIEIHQGDLVYMNETIDISQAVSWPDYQIVWCKGNNYDCSPPDQLIDVSAMGNMHTFYVDPNLFNYGDYYRWDGKWHKGENANAFRVIPGTRPVLINLTNESEPNTTPNYFKEGPFHYLIARGDSPRIYSTVNRTDVCHIWLFTNSLSTLDIPMDNLNFTQYHNFTTADTYGMEAGTYTGYLQFKGLNGFQDIYTDGNYLDTPYDDSKVPDVPIITWNMGNVKAQFDQLKSETPYFDDVLIPVTLTVEDPAITVTEVTQEENKLWISGVTNWDNNTVITLQLDPDNYALPLDKARHTWKTFVIGDIDSKRTFSTAMPIDRSELSVGPHSILMTVDKDKGLTETDYTFKVSDVYVMPTPTPELKRMVLTDKNDPIPTLVTAVPTKTVQTLVAVTTTRRYNVTTNSTVPVATPRLTQEIPVLKQTAAVSNATPTRTRDSNIYVDIPVWIPVLGLLTVLVLRRRE